MTIEEILIEIRDWLNGGVRQETELDSFLSAKGFYDFDIEYIKGQMLNNDFSLMNGTVKYRGGFIAKLPPNQNPNMI